MGPKVNEENSPGGQTGNKKVMPRAGEDVRVYITMLTQDGGEGLRKHRVGSIEVSSEDSRPGRPDLLKG